MFPSGWQVAENIQWRFNYPFLQNTGLPQAICREDQANDLRKVAWVTGSDYQKGNIKTRKSGYSLKPPKLFI